MELFEVNKKGRPRKYNEPVTRKAFDFPVSFAEKLTSLSEERRQSATEIIMIALEKEIAGSVPAPKLRVIPQIKQIDIKAAVLEALKEQQSASAHVVELPDDLNKKLEKVRASLGFTESSQVIEQLLRVMLRDPHELRERIMSKAMTDIEKAFGMTPEFEEKPKRAKKVA